MGAGVVPLRPPRAAFGAIFVVFFSTWTSWIEPRKEISSESSQEKSASKPTLLLAALLLLCCRHRRMRVLNALFQDRDCVVQSLAMKDKQLSDYELQLGFSLTRSWTSVPAFRSKCERDSFHDFPILVALFYDFWRRLGVSTTIKQPSQRVCNGRTPACNRSLWKVPTCRNRIQQRGRNKENV